jgi:hypothetical protein
MLVFSALSFVDIFINGFSANDLWSYQEDFKIG